MNSGRIDCNCPNCGARYCVAPDKVGRRVNCRTCNQVFRLQDVTQVQGDEWVMPQVGTARPPVIAASVEPSKPRTVPPGQKPANHFRCDFCHEYIPNDDYWEHKKLHQGKEDDGQYRAYRTLPPEERYAGSLDRVPQLYIHEKCGGITGMPEDIIRTYLVDPFFYANNSFCGGCGRHAAHRELTWQDTRQTLKDYFSQLKANDPKAGERKRNLIVTFVGLAAFAGLLLGMPVAFVGFFWGGLLTALVWLVFTLLICVLVLPPVFLFIRGGF